MSKISTILFMSVAIAVVSSQQAFAWEPEQLTRWEKYELQSVVEAPENLLSLFCGQLRGFVKSKAEAKKITLQECSNRVDNYYNDPGSVLTPFNELDKESDLYRDTYLSKVRHKALCSRCISTKLIENIF